MAANHSKCLWRLRHNTALANTKAHQAAAITVSFSAPRATIFGASSGKPILSLFVIAVSNCGKSRQQLWKKPSAISRL
jgi:hypothetical protein